MKLHTKPTTCSKCGGQTFEIAILEVNNFKWGPWVAQCSTCGTAIGIIPQVDINQLALPQSHE
jgi:hypothetical protein